MSSTSTLAQRVSDLLEERRRRRLDERALRHDLSSCRTRAEVEDLLLTVDRFEGPEVEKIRSVLNEQALRRHGTPFSTPIAS